MKILGDFFKAFIYFKENGIPEKLAKELAEKLTGVKADDFNRNIDNLNIEDVQIKNKGQPKQLATKKMRGDLPFINTKLSNPMTNKMVLKGLDGTQLSYIVTEVLNNNRINTSSLGYKVESPADLSEKRNIVV